MNINSYKKSIRESSFSREDETVIWDFYVTKSLSHASSQHRWLSDYHQDDFTRPFNLMKRMMMAAGVKDEQCKIVTGKSMNKGLEQLNLLADTNVGISTDNPRIACLIPSDREGEGKQYSEKKCVINVMVHARNALAHGNTYFFDNGFVMLEDFIFDKFTRVTTTTARMLFHKNTLLAWIKLFDKEKRYYPEIHI